MPAPTHLVLFTNVFPNDRVAEVTFVGPELSQLSAVFDQIIVVPSVGGTVSCPLPNGAITVDETYPRMVHPDSTWSRIGYAIRGMSAPWSRAEVRRQLALLGSPRMLGRLLYCVVAAQRTGAWLTALLADGRLDPRRTLVYTFWLDYRTAGAGLARRCYPELQIVSRAHGTDVYEDRHPLSYLPLRRHAVETADQVFVVSEAARQHLQGRYPSHREAFVVAPLGTVDPGFRCPPSSDGVFRIVSCSRLIPQKRIDRLIDALALVPGVRGDTRIEWHHLGGGEEQLRVKAHAEAALPTSVSWSCSGVVSPERVFSYYREHPVDLFVSVSASEGKPVSIMEAQSASIPVLATAVGGVPEMVNDSNGWLLASDPTPEEIASGIQCAIQEHPSTERRLASRRTWESSHDAGRVSVNFAHRLRNLLDD